MIYPMIHNSKTVKIVSLLVILLLIVGVIAFIIYKARAPYKALFIANENGNYYFINENGKKVTKERFQFIATRHNQVFRICQEGKWGYLDKNMNNSIEPQYEACGDFNSDLAPVLQGGKWSYINKKGQIISKEQYDWAGEFNEGKAVIKKESAFYIINQNGKKLKGPYALCFYVYDNSYLVQNKSDSQAYFIDSSLREVHIGKEVISLIYMDGKAISYSYVKDKKLACKVLLRKFNKVKLDNYYKLTPQKNGRTFFMKVKGEKWGIMNEDYEIISNPIYDNVISNSDSLFPINMNGKWGAINRNNQIVIEPQFEQISSFLNGYASFTKTNEKWGIINEKGKMILPEKYDSIFYAISDGGIINEF